MTVKWEKTGTNVGVLEVEVGLDRFSEALDVAFKKVVKQVALPGFRKGKVPRKIFENRFGLESLYQDAVDYLLPQAYTEAVNEAGITPVDRPEVDVVQVEAGKPFIFKATVTVKPEVELGNYKGIEISDKSVVVEQSDIDEEVERLRASHAEIDVVEDGEIQSGDSVSIDFLGTTNGEPFEGGEAENYQLDVGSGTFIGGFEEQLIGMKPGEERDIEVTFPEDYHVKSLAGQGAAFHCKLHDIKRKSLRELSDEFVQEISEFQTVDEFVEDVKKQLQSRKDQERERYIEDQAVDAAVDAATVDVPAAMVEQEIENQVQNFAQQLQTQQIPLDAYIEFTGMTEAELREQFRDSAVKNVRSSLVLEGISKVEGLEPSEEDLNEELQKIAESAGLEADRVREILEMRDPGLTTLKGDLRTRKTVSFLVEHSKVV